MPKGENSTPPIEHRFKPGKSGNPKGKPKGAIEWRKRFENLLNQQMEEGVPDITKRRRKNAKGEYIEPQAMKPGKVADYLVTSLAAQGFKGNTRAAEMIIAYTGGGKLIGPGGAIEGDDNEVPITQININIIDPNGLLKKEDDD